MKKRLVVLTILVLAIFIVVTPALAASPGKIFTVLGEITALDLSAITIYVVDANRLATPYIGEILSVQVTEDTQYYRSLDVGKVPIEFDDLQVGDTANIRGYVFDGYFIALRVIIDVECQQ